MALHEILDQSTKGHGRAPTGPPPAASTTRGARSSRRTAARRPAAVLSGVAVVFTVGGLVTVIADGEDAVQTVVATRAIPESDAPYMDPAVPFHVSEAERAIPESDAPYMDPGVPVHVSEAERAIPESDAQYMDPRVPS